MRGQYCIVWESVVTSSSVKVLQRKEDDGRNLNILFSNGKIDPDDAIGVLARGREREWNKDRNGFVLCT